MKLHLCCGDIYLSGYVNCDVTGAICSDTGVQPVATTLDHYYRCKQIGHKSATIVDCRMNLLELPWPFPTEGAEQIVMISGIEHFSKKDAAVIIAEVYRVLEPGGTFLVDFPDILGSVMKYYTKNPEFLMRHIYCNHKDQYSIHHWGYTRKTIKDLLGPGWRVRFGEIVKHDYPVIGCKATKL